MLAPESLPVMKNFSLTLLRDLFDLSTLTLERASNGVGVDESLVDLLLHRGQLAANDLLVLDRQVLGEEGLRAPDDAAVDETGQLLQLLLALLGVRVGGVGVAPA